ncbi:MAG: hypothetical protein GEV28_24905 [Actinophytocola sp.]|uniref:hypothetical protein n=1 Tax=Actinophytocola sp. TaxID=1872138 RepID=UPI001320C56B|nr:hypothetical protein [Actinophytocola sp.]MPZ83454.1 hypothetical protein [Actinophytocola sp.]
MRRQQAWHPTMAAGRRRVMLAGLLAGAAFAVAGCTNAVAGAPSGVDIGPLTTAEGAAEALVDFAEAASVHYTGSLVAGDGAELTVDVNATLTGEVSGKITVNGLVADVLLVADTLYLKGAADFWSGMVARFGVTSGDGSALAGRWVKLPTSLIGVEFSEIFTPDVVSQAAGKVEGAAGRTELTKNAKESVAGVDAYVVEVEGGTVYIAAEKPHGVLRFELDKLGSADTTSVTDVVLDVADSSPGVVAFYQSLDKAAAGLNTAVDALTGVEQGAHRFEACGAPSCSLVVDIKNTAKSAVRVHLKADWTGDGKALGSCEGNAGPVAPGAGGKISCKIATPQWVSFYQTANSVPGTHPYGAQWSALVLADPPDLADLKTRATAKPASADDAKTDGSYALYQISYAGKVWKYGVVPNRYWRDHAAEQLRGCLASTKSACSASLVTATEDPVSAHALAAQLVAKHEDGCPAGQWVSCPR